ncbi:MAG: H+transporting two-sector ATPase subunit [Rhodocyclaceae bacterium]|nr:H+transporting two-sector ATPase subunit [Rhodocyclaceae bacterium]
MEFDATTFALEIINFLVLVWLLQRLLYKPVTAAIARRQAGIEKTLADARAVRAEAEALKAQFENRMADWEKERARARERLAEEMAAERTRLMAALAAGLDEERARATVLEQRRAQEEQQRQAARTRAEGGRFVARLLSRLASAELEESIGRLLLADLPRLPAEELQVLRAAVQAGEAKVVSAYPLEEGLRNRLAEALGTLSGKPVACDFGQEPGLMAGLRISIGPWVLSASLADELKFFAEADHGGR